MSENLGPDNALSVELCAAMKGIDVAYQKKWFNFRLETDYRFAVMAFGNDSIVPWSLSNRWFNCKKLLLHMNFLVSHIYREGNQCANGTHPRVSTDMYAFCR